MSENPGHVETARDRAIQSRSLRRDEHPQDLLGALVFLASADSDFITGQTIAVDGGNVNTLPAFAEAKGGQAAWPRAAVCEYLIFRAFPGR